MFKSYKDTFFYDYSNEQVATASMDAIKRLAGLPQGMVGEWHIPVYYEYYLESCVE